MYDEPAIVAPEVGCNNDKYGDKEIEGFYEDPYGESFIPNDGPYGWMNTSPWVRPTVVTSVGRYEDKSSKEVFLFAEMSSLGVVELRAKTKYKVETIYRHFSAEVTQGWTVFKVPEGPIHYSAVLGVPTGRGSPRQLSTPPIKRSGDARSFVEDIVIGTSSVSGVGSDAVGIGAKISSDITVYIKYKKNNEVITKDLISKQISSECSGLNVISTITMTIRDNIKKTLTATDSDIANLAGISSKLRVAESALNNVRLEAVSVFNRLKDAEAELERTKASVLAGGDASGLSEIQTKVKNLGIEFNTTNADLKQKLTTVESLGGGSLTSGGGTGNANMLLIDIETVDLRALYAGVALLEIDILGACRGTNGSYKRHVSSYGDTTNIKSFSNKTTYSLFGATDGGYKGPDTGDTDKIRQGFMFNNDSILDAFRISTEKVFSVNIENCVPVSMVASNLVKNLAVVSAPSSSCAWDYNAGLVYHVAEIGAYSYDFDESAQVEFDAESKNFYAGKQLAFYYVP